MVFRRSARWSSEGPPRGPLEGLHTVFRRSAKRSSEGLPGLQKVRQVFRKSARSSESPPGLQKVVHVAPQLVLRRCWTKLNKEPKLNSSVLKEWNG